MQETELPMQYVETAEQNLIEDYAGETDRENSYGDC